MTFINYLVERGRYKILYCIVLSPRRLLLLQLLRPNGLYLFIYYASVAKLE